MKLDIISLVVVAFCLCVCVSLAVEAKRLFSDSPVEVVIVKAP